MASYIGCTTCEHPFGAHARGAGACRINGCPCLEYGVGLPSRVEPAELAPLVPDRRVDLVAIAAAAATGLIVGLFMGVRL
jgi:hypothetical protein